MGGMRFDGDDIRRMPVHMQEQVGAALVARFEQDTHGGEVKKAPIRVAARKLHFLDAKAVERYMVLKDAVREGVIYDLICIKYDGCIVAFEYKIAWNGAYIPTGIPIPDLVGWRGMAPGEKMIEHLTKGDF